MPVLTCVINVSEAARADVLAELHDAAGTHLLDVHADVHHNRSVLTLAAARRGPGSDVVEAAMAVAAAAVARIDLRRHRGVHPRLGAVDVVPFVPVPAGRDSAALGEAVAARHRFATRAAAELALPCFLYGPERPLPEVRRRAFTSLDPDTGPTRPHPTAGAACVGARPVLVAYNVWLAPPADVDTARRLARALRGPAVRALGFDVGGTPQVSCNLVDPLAFGPADVFELVAAQAPVARCEVVGLVPAAVMDSVPSHRWDELDLDPTRTIEARLEQAGLDGGSSRAG